MGEKSDGAKLFIVFCWIKYKIKDGYYHSILILDVNKYRGKRPEFEVEYEYIGLEDLDDLLVLEAGEKLKKIKEYTEKNNETMREGQYRLLHVHNATKNNPFHLEDLEE